MFKWYDKLPTALDNFFLPVRSLLRKYCSPYDAVSANN